MLARLLNAMSSQQKGAVAPIAFAAWDLAKTGYSSVAVSRVLNIAIRPHVSKHDCSAVKMSSPKLTLEAFFYLSLNLRVAPTITVSRWDDRKVADRPAMLSAITAFR